MHSMPELPPRTRSVYEVQRPNLGLYLDRPETQIPDRAVSDCQNVRLRDGRITNENVGYELFFAQSLGDQVLLIDDFIKSDGSSTTIFGTRTDLFRYDSPTESPLYITPRYVVGTVTVTNGLDTVTGSGTTWSTNLKSGDYFHSGSSTENDPAEIWYEIQSVDSNTQITLTENYGEASLGGQAYTTRLVFTADNADYWNSTVFPDAPTGAVTSLAAGDHWFATNSKEIVVWDASGTTVTVLATATTGLAFTCKDITYYKNMLLYGNIVESGSSKPSTVKNSAIADPENVTTLEANEFIMAEEVDFIEAIMPLGDFVVVYAENSVNIAQFIGSPAIFAIRTVAPGVGVYSGRTIIDFGDYHEFIGHDRAYRFDGVRLESFGDQVFPDVLRRADRSRSSKSLAALSEEELEVYWVVPLASDGSEENKSAEIAYTEHYAENVGRNPTPFMRRQLPATAIGFFVDSPIGRFSDFTGMTFEDITFRFNDRYFTSNFPVVLFGDEDGGIWRMNTRTGTELSLFWTAYADTATFALVDGNSKGVVRRIEPYVEKNTSPIGMISFLTVSNRIDGDAVDTKTLPYHIDQSGERYTPTRAVGRYGKVRFVSITTTDVWRMQGYRITSDRVGDR